MGHHYELPLTGGSWNYVPTNWGTTMRSHLEPHGITP